MTSMYKCDKCGQMFTDYEEAYSHENMHWVLDRGYHVEDDTLDSMTEYKEGQEEPHVIHVVFSRWNTEKGEYEKRCGKYKLVSSYEAPLVVSNE